MQVRKKISREEKYFRRLKEAEKAREKAESRKALGSFSDNNKDADKGNLGMEVGSTMGKDTKYQLPVGEIKMDLVKNILFGVFSIAAIAVLGYLNAFTFLFRRQ